MFEILSTKHPLLLFGLITLLVAAVLVLAWLVLRTADAGMHLSLWESSLDISRCGS
jgi:hypothetical protein